MSLIPWRRDQQSVNPFRDFDAIFKWPEFSTDTSEQAWMPAIDVVESEKDFLIKADVPGLDKNDIQVAIDGDTLTIKGEKKTEKKTEENGVLRQERITGRFYRSFSLPENVDKNEVKASYENGVLELTVPKSKDAPKKLINVNVK